jgi:integrator complex subunit 11
VFKRWAGDERNMVILPGYCVAGTVGNKVLTSKTGIIEMDGGKTQIDMRCSVRSISFSAHADAKGILQLIKDVEPKNVMLVHGESQKMEFFRNKVEKDFKIKCFAPPNGCTIDIPVETTVEVNVSRNLLKRSFVEDDQNESTKRTKSVVGILVSKNDGVSS